MNDACSYCMIKPTTEWHVCKGVDLRKQIDRLKSEHDKAAELLRRVDEYDSEHHRSCRYRLPNDRCSCGLLNLEADLAKFNMTTEGCQP